MQEKSPEIFVMKLNPKITAKIRTGNERGYVAECEEIAVVTQGNTLDEVVYNLKEAVLLHLEDEYQKTFGLVVKPIHQVFSIPNHSDNDKIE